MAFGESEQMQGANGNAQQQMQANSVALNAHQNLNQQMPQHHYQNSQQQQQPQFMG